MSVPLRCYVARYMLKLHAVPGTGLLYTAVELLAALEATELPYVEYVGDDGHMIVFLDTGFGAGAYVGLPCTLDGALASIAESVLEVHR